MPRKLIGFERMWNAYPAPGGTAEDARKVIGGDADAAWLTNTCVMRVCRSLNYSGYPIPSGFKDLSTVRGADGLRYAFRVEEFRRYLTFSYGPPALVEERATPKDGPPKCMEGVTGLMMFRVKGWVDATGHIDLWNGSETRHAEYFSRASSILLWTVERGGVDLLPAGTAPVKLSGSVGHKGANKPEDVARVQALLSLRGLDPGGSDGVVSAATIDAIAELQKRYLQAPDGRVDPNGRTWRELNGM